MTPIDDPSWHFVSESKPCTVCNGTGRDRYDWRCWQCDGKGAYAVARLKRDDGAGMADEAKTRTELEQNIT